MWMNAVLKQAIWIIGLSVALLAACGGDDDSPGATSTDVKPDAGPVTPEQDAAVPPVPDAAPGFVPGGEPGVLPADANFEGVPTAAIPYGLAPQGCAEGLDANGRLALVLGLGISAVYIAVAGDEVQANGVTCGTQAITSTATATHSIDISGDADDNQVIVDLSLGAFGDDLLAATSPITIDLGEGTDLLAVMGTHSEDRIQLGSLNAENLLRFGDAGSQLRIANTESLVVSAGPGNDTVSAGGGEGLGDPAQIPIQLYGGDGDDNLQGGANADRLFGGAGDDSFATFASPDGGDTYDGGEGTDLVSYVLRSAALSITVGAGADDGEYGEADDVQASVEQVTAGSGDDVVVGSDQDNVLIGGPGSDVLSGLGGNDIFIEAALAEGSDTVNGGDDSDTIDYSGRLVTVHFTACTASPAACQSGACGCGNNNGEADEHDVLIGVENAYAGAGNDVLTGNEAQNWLFGGEGDDQLFGGAEADTLYGGDGIDVVDGGGYGEGDICVIDESEVHSNCELGG